MSANLIYIRDCNLDADVYFDPNGVEGLTIKWTGKKDYSVYIYDVVMYMRSGNIITCTVKEDAKEKIQKILH
ncbi:hypothetical protein AVENLUH5627_02678 [Acinetobacter venetianus]|uniref:Uncharacterized protein n=1 Tax=Acinetobacter venetianus TaxID=52133 RepID=A0A150HLC5_9GAMM|nr:hypothetical protein [Acinetobacter venetianus]KXZ65948.1 hypothetical protein AVENLUH5627_02678 [Acinetobacter venetianus]